jgi:hypothetical protein
MQRAFDNPVTVLEELKGEQRRQRLRVLHGKYSDVALGNHFTTSMAILACSARGYSACRACWR